jgi:hypothetical protein
VRIAGFSGPFRVSPDRRDQHTKHEWPSAKLITYTRKHRLEPDRTVSWGFPWLLRVVCGVAKGDSDDDGKRRLDSVRLGVV